MADVSAQSRPPAVKKEKEKRKKKVKKEVAAKEGDIEAAQEQPVGPGTTEGDDRSFQPGGSFAVRDDTCALELSGEDTELLLLQLPHSWPMAGGGVISLDPRGNVGSCTDDYGQDYHVLQDSCAPSPQIYLIAPGKKMRPKPIDRRFALVRADHLPTLLRQATVASDAQEPQVEKQPKQKKKKRKENGKAAQLVPCNTETAGNKSSVRADDGKVMMDEKAARKARKEGKKKRKKEREKNEDLITN